MKKPHEIAELAAIGGAVGLLLWLFYHKQPTTSQSSETLPNPLDQQPDTYTVPPMALPTLQPFTIDTTGAGNWSPSIDVQAPALAGATPYAMTGGCGCGAGAGAGGPSLVGNPDAWAATLRGAIETAAAGMIA